MDEKIEMSQAMNGEQHLRELLQRITDKAEKMTRRGFSTLWKHRWIVIAVLAILVAVIVAAEVYSYRNNDLWGFNAWLVVVGVTGFIVDRIMFMIMRRYFKRMKNASSAPQLYREVKQLIRLHKLRQWIPITVAIICGFLVKKGTDFLSVHLLNDSAVVLGVILGAAMGNWFLDEDFRDDVDELRDLVEQEVAE